MKLPKFDWKNIDWFSIKPPKERIVIGIVVLLAGSGLFYLGKMSSSGPSAPSQQNVDRKEVFGGGSQVAFTGSDPVPLQPVGGGNCRTYAPEGWHVTDENQQGTAFTVSSADGSESATYSAAGVGGGLVAGYYGEQYRTPEKFALYIIGMVTREQPQPSGPEQAFGYYEVLNFATASHRGYALLYRFGIPADPGGYGVIMRIAVGNTSDPRSLARAGSVAAATRCNSQLVPPPAVLPRPTTDDKTRGTGKSSDDDVTMAGTYNAQLGTGWVHDSTGRSYNVSVTDDYHETGPDGPGYYKRNGNDLIKLQPGLGN